jgi:ribosomal protein L25 (general stress protein Ctc)
MAEIDGKKRPPDEDADLAEAARVFGPFEADLIKNFLESHGIISIIRGRTAPFVYPLTVDGMAEFKVMVQESDLEKAKDLLASMPEADEENGSGKAG